MSGKTTVNDQVRLSGWLRKEKRSASIGSGSSRRWFVIEPVYGEGGLLPHHDDESAGEDGGGDHGELALCYYKSPNSPHRCGWFFLSDVLSVEQDRAGRWIEVRHHSRMYRLKTGDHVKHQKWYETLKMLCPSGEAEDRKEEREASATNIQDGDEAAATIAETNEEHLPESDNYCSESEEESDGDLMESDCDEEGGDAVEEDKNLRELNFLRELSGKSPLKSPPATATRGSSGAAEAKESIRDQPATKPLERSPNECKEMKEHSKSVESRGISYSDDGTFEKRAEVESTAKGGNTREERSNVRLGNDSPRQEPLDEKYDHRLHTTTELHSSETTSKRLGRVISVSRLESDEQIIEGGEGTGSDSPRDPSSPLRGIASAHDMVEDISELEDEGLEDIPVQTISDQTPVVPEDKHYSLLKCSNDIVINLEDTDSEEEKEDFAMGLSGPEAEREKTTHAGAQKLTRRLSMEPHCDPRELAEAEIPEGTDTLQTINGHVVCVASPKCHGSKSSRPGGTKPQYSFPPGLTPDKNFVTEDWDDSDSEESSTKHQQRTSPLNKPPPTSRSPLKKLRSFYSTVEADTHFIEEDWDD